MKTNALCFFLKSLPLAMLLSFQLLFSCNSRGQHLVPDQDPSFPLYTYVDSIQLKKYEAVFDFETFNLNQVHQLRKTLQADLPKQDPMIEWLYANTMDLYSYGHGNPKDAAIALTYYTKAADKGMARAEYFLHKLYWHGFMEVPRNEQKSLAYLKRAIQHGHKEGKAQGYLAMATLFDENEPNKLFKPNKDSVLFYLEKALALTPNDTWALDYAGGICEEKGDYEKAVTYRMRSDNEQSHIEVAKWYMEGKHVKKDVNRALQILYTVTDKLIKDLGEGLDGYMGGSNPIHVLNDWYLCKKWITREQLGKYYNKNWICD